MDTTLIKKLLKKYRCFRGVFPCDKLPYDLNLPLNIIVNTDPSHLPGEHWVGISINEKGKGYYFDSFGLPPLIKEIFDFLEVKCHSQWKYNKVTLQNINSKTCGNYCVLFTIFKCEGLSNKNFISKFSGKTEENDYKIERIFANFSLVKKL